MIVRWLQPAKLIQPKPIREFRAMKSTDLVDNQYIRTDVPDFASGDEVKVHVKVVEGTR